MVGCGKVDLPGRMHSFVHICLIALFHLENKIALDGEIFSNERTNGGFPDFLLAGKKRV
jgi:hypothetical protein